VAANTINALPPTLPSSLLALYAARNQVLLLHETKRNFCLTTNDSRSQLSQWPVLPDGLLTLHVDTNNYKALPNTLPTSLRRLYLGSNQITGSLFPKRSTIMKFSNKTVVSL
jgi:hypothetical protein